MATRTYSKQQPYGIKGTVIVNGSGYEGAEIWVRDTTEGTVPAPVDDYTHIFTNADGKYNINLAQSVQAISDGDSVTVYCKVGDIIDKTTITVNTKLGYAVANFTITRRSGATDGIRGSPLSSGKGSLYPGTDSGCIDGLM